MVTKREVLKKVSHDSIENSQKKKKKKPGKEILKDSKEKTQIVKKRGKGQGK